MNYRHSYHAGNFADVFKHALLVRLMRAMQRKPTGFVFVDTHAGRGSYDLERASEGQSKARRAEWPEGIGRLWQAPEAPEEVADYLKIVRDYDLVRGNLLPTPRFYPGSPRIAKAAARPQDRLELWEKHPEECDALQAEFGQEKRVSIHRADGYGAIKACLPPRERRALVLVDPPFEAQDEWEAVIHALEEAIRRFPSGTYAIWHPLSDRLPADAFSELGKTVAVANLSVELSLDPSFSGLKGCAVVIVNPPWRFDEEARTIARYLATTFGRGQAAQGSVRWRVPK